MRCHALLTEAGYAAMDLATYRRVRGPEDFPPGTGIANVLFAPEETAAGNPYFRDAPPVTVAEIPAGAFVRAEDGSIGLNDPVDLPPGRYIVSAHFTASGKDNEIFSGVEADGETIFRYHTYTALMAENYTEWVVQIDRPSRVAPYLRFLRGSDPTLRWTGATIRRLPAFDGWAAPVIE